MMQVFKADQLVPYDCDDTLVMWNLEDKSNQISIPDPYLQDVINFVTPNKNHIELLKKHKSRGFTIIVWSAGGVEWAEAVVKALKLEEYVDIVLPKPCRYVDDLPVIEWFGNRVYIK